MKDVIIIGCGLGGLECGYILASEGYHVLILEREAQRRLHAELPAEWGRA